MDIKKKFISIIKIISTILITSAIVLESWNAYGVMTNSNIPSSLHPIFWIERFAVTCHLIEAIIAAFYASAKKKMPVKYGIYTFFVGTVGLWELFSQEYE